MSVNEIDWVLLHISKGAASRKKILQKLLLNSKNCNQLANECGLEWWSVQKHLLILSKEKLINRIKFGHITFYKITVRGQNALKVISETD